MSYPALMEKLDMGGPTGGADMPGAEAGGGLMGEPSGSKEGEVEGGKGEPLVKGEARVEAGGNWEDREGTVGRGLLKAGREGRGGRGAVESGGFPMVLGRDRGLDRPMVMGGGLTAAAPVRGGVGLAGGVVSIPLSSIIFSACYLHFFSLVYSC